MQDTLIGFIGTFDKEKGDFIGEWKPLSQLKTSALDRGYLFGDGIYDVIGFFGNKPIGSALHARRLSLMIDALSYPNLAGEYMERLYPTYLTALVERNPAHFAKAKSGAYFQLTRGIEVKRTHLPREALSPTLLLIPQAIMTFEKPVAAITHKNPKADFGAYKFSANMGAVRLKEKAKEVGAVEAIVHEEGHAIEGASSNLFVVKDETIYTPPLNGHILAGITRHILIKLLQRHTHLTLKEAPIPLSLLQKADEIWLTGALKHLLVIDILDGAPVGRGTYPVAENVKALYHKHAVETFSVDSLQLWAYLED